MTVHACRKRNLEAVTRSHGDRSGRRNLGRPVGRPVTGQMSAGDPSPDSHERHDVRTHRMFLGSQVVA
jgi:hypothetical protein